MIKGYLAHIRRFRVAAALVLVLAMVSIPLWSALASGTCWTNSDFAGTGSDAKACKEAWTNADGTYWKGRMQSYMSPSVNIDRIGWWWWTDQQKCGGTPIAFYDYGGSVGYNTSNWASTSAWQLNYYCALTNQGWVNGRHDFYEGGTTWYPQYSYVISLPKYKNP